MLEHHLWNSFYRGQTSTIELVQFSPSSQKISPISKSYSFRNPLQGRRKYLKLRGTRHVGGTFFLKKRGHFLKRNRALLCLSQNLGSTCTQWRPVPTSMILCLKHIFPWPVGIRILYKKLLMTRNSTFRSPKKLRNSGRDKMKIKKLSIFDGGDPWHIFALFRLFPVSHYGTWATT